LRLRMRVPGAGQTDTLLVQVGGRQVAWTLTAVNSPPSFVSSAVTNAPRGSLYSYQVVGSDPESRPLKITASTPLPSWLTLGAASAGPGAGQYKAVLSGTPGNAQALASPFSITLKLDDSAGGTASQSFSIAVPNAAPIFSAVPAGSDLITEGQPYNFTFDTSDSDRASGDTCTLSAPTLPAWLTATPDNVGCKITLSGTPSHANVGIHAVILLVLDYVGSHGGTGGGDAPNFSIDVQAIPIHATNDSFNAVGNTRLNVGHSGGAPSIKAPIRTSVMNNDTFASGLVPGVDVVATLEPGTLTPGAILNLSADGSFDLTPPAGAPSVSFQYKLYDGATSSNGTVTVNYSNRIWYVNNLASAGTGTSLDPFSDLGAAAGSANAAGDTIYVYAGDGTHNKQNLGVVLDANNQRLIGQGSALTTLPIDVDGSSAIPFTLLPPGPRPKIGNAGGNAIGAIGTGISVTGLDVDGASADGINTGGGLTVGQLGEAMSNHRRDGGRPERDQWRSVERVRRPDRRRRFRRRGAGRQRRRQLQRAGPHHH